MTGRAPGAVERPLVKICGVTRPEDAAVAAELGADLVGLNFYPPSPRYLDPVRDRGLVGEVVAAVREAGSAGAETGRFRGNAGGGAGRVLVVGVFVNEQPFRVEEIMESAGLDLVQLHGDEGPEMVGRLGRRAIKVFRRDTPPGSEELADYAEAWGFLFDVPASAGRDPGGTSMAWEYKMLAAVASDRPVLVAGGIRPGNARRALQASGADGVDVCYGIESAPGLKDPERMRRLFEEVRHGTP